MNLSNTIVLPFNLVLLVLLLIVKGKQTPIAMQKLCVDLNIFQILSASMLDYFRQPQVCVVNIIIVLVMDNRDAWR